MKTRTHRILTLIAILAAIIILPLLAFAQAGPETGTPTDGGFTWTGLIAAIGAVIIAARLIVKLTPTPADDTALEKVITFLKHVGLNVKTIAWLIVPAALLLVGCNGIPSGTTAGVNAAPDYVGGAVGVPLGTNAVLTATGGVNPNNTDDWNAGVQVTFRAAPTSATQAQFAALILEGKARTGKSEWVYQLGKVDPTDDLVVAAVEAALREGATISGIRSN
jgi:hypothetical protein